MQHRRWKLNQSIQGPAPTEKQQWLPDLRNGKARNPHLRAQWKPGPAVERRGQQSAIPNQTQP
eukprot:2593048-Alexandrium_andersonii.AAC.1